jgi:hypothetical protein
MPIDQFDDVAVSPSLRLVGHVHAAVVSQPAL